MILAAIPLVISPAFAKTAKKRKKSAMPDIPVQSKEERAAGLWQAGTLSASKGDFESSVDQFQGCLKADPKNAECRSALKDAKYHLKLNPVKHKKRKHKAALAAGAADTAKAAAGAPAAPPAGAPPAGPEAPK